MATFEELLSELGAEIKQDLKPDRHNNCLLQLKEDIEVCLRPDADTNEITILFRVGEVPPGKGREALFRVALITNAHLMAYAGYFAYSRRTNELVLVERANMNTIDGKELLNIIIPLIDTARQWREAIRAGHIPSTPITGGSGG